MATNKDELEALRRIEQLLEQQPEAQAPGAAEAVNREQEEPPVDPQAIQQAEAQAATPENQSETTNAILEQILTELQAVSNAIQELTS